MQKLFLFLLLALPCTTYGQSSDSQTPDSQTLTAEIDLPAAPAASSSASSSAAWGASAINSPAALPTATGTGGVVASLAESYVYVYSPNQFGANRSLMGWSVTPSVSLAHHLVFQGDVESLYMRSIYPAQSRQIYAAGGRVDFAPKFSLNPFVFAEGGEMRLAAQRTLLIDWNPIAKGGFGFECRLGPRFSLQLIPGEYLGQHLDNGNWNHSFTSRVGIKFNLTGNTYPSA